MNDKAKPETICKECGIELGPLVDINTFRGRCEMCDEIRNQFAAAALIGLCAEDMSADDWKQHYAKIAAIAFELADAMMAARKVDDIAEQLDKGGGE